MELQDETKFVSISKEADNVILRGDFAVRPPSNFAATSVRPSPDFAATILYYALIRLIMETTYGFSQNASKAYDFVVFILPDYTNKSISRKVRTKHLQLDC
jgi:hypothetical protein